MMCKLPWCSNTGSPLPFDGYCSLDHRDFHELEMEAEGYREEIAKLHNQRQVLVTAIQDHYDVWRTKNWRLRLAQNKWLWLAIGVPEDDIDNVPG